MRHFHFMRPWITIPAIEVYSISRRCFQESLVAFLRPLDRDSFGFIRIERMGVLKKVDMVCTLEVKQNNLREESHVHELTVSHVRHPWLRVPQDRFFRGPRLLHHGATPRTLPLSRVRLGGRAWPGTQGSLLANGAHRPQADLPPP